MRQRQGLLAGWIRSALCSNPLLDRRVRAACQWLTSDSRLDIGTLADRFAWNVRTIRRDFHAACGYGPKHFQRIMRIQRAIRESHEPSRANLVEVALAAGYADQAHMTRDFRDITGFTPAQHLATTRSEFGLWVAEGWSRAPKPSADGAVRNVQDRPDHVPVMWRGTLFAPASWEEEP